MKPTRMFILLSAVALLWLCAVGANDDDNYIRIKKRKKTSNGQGAQTRRRVESPAPTQAVTTTTTTTTSAPPPLEVTLAEGLISKIRRRRRKKQPLHTSMAAGSLETASTDSPFMQSPPPEEADLEEETFKMAELSKNRTKDDPRFLSMFTIVRFNNDACFSSTGTNGTCYSTSDCSNLGGTNAGSCASGFGVCCLFTVSCGGSTSQNCTYFQSSGYPSTYSSVGACQVTINKAANVCELRLDFENFNLAGPETTDNTCNTDQFVVSGGQPIPSLCGVNTGQHIYVDTGLTSNSPVVLSAITTGTSSSRSFSIKVTQVLCTSTNQAPSGCLQYFTGVSGQLQSFNYQTASGLQLSNTDYSMCIRMEQNFCSITYTACPDTTNSPTMSFSISGGPTAQGSMVGTNCATDWIIIPCASNTLNVTGQSGTPSVCVDRICGMVFNSVTTAAGTASTSVYSFVKPFSVTVHTNSVEGSGTPVDTRNRGFCLNYIQNPCTTSTGG